MPVFGQAVKKCRIVHAARIPLCQNHDVESGQFALLLPERLSHDALQAIPPGRETAVFLCYRQPEPRRVRAVRPGQDDEQVIPAATSSAEYAAVCSGVRQSVDSCGRRGALVVVVDSCRDRRRDGTASALRSELRPPLGASALQYQAPRFGSHTRAESVGTGSFEPARLERAFHFRDTCIGDRRVRAVGKIAG